MRGIEVEGDWAYSWDTWTDSATNKETGEVRDEVGKWINVLRSTPDGWKIYIDLWNRDAPAAEYTFEVVSLRVAFTGGPRHQ